MEKAMTWAGQSVGKGDDVGTCFDKKHVMPAKAFNLKGDDAGYCIDGYCLDKRQVISLGQGDDVGYCLEKREVMPVKALETAMTWATALTKGR